MDTPNAGGATAKKKLYACGTLTYTKAALVGVFFWVLWGNFCLVMMMAVVPSVLPLKLKVLACPDWLMGAILASMIYGYFIFKFAETHMREICVGSALLYGVGMGLMCLLVKEGGYPPLDGKEQRQSRGLAGSLTAFFQSTLGGMAGFPREIRVFPQSRFGQFCSAQAMLRSLCQTVAGILAGLFIDVPPALAVPVAPPDQH